MRPQINNKIKIAVSVLGNDILENNGLNVRAKRIAELLKEKYNVTLIGRGNKGQELKDTIIIKPAKTKLWNFKLIPVIIRNRFDYIYCVDDLFGFLTYYMFSKIYRYKIIFDITRIHSEFSTSPRLPTIIYRIIEKFVIRYADHVTAVAGYVINFYQKYNENINLVPLFADEDVFRKNEITTKQNIKKNNKLLGIIGPFNTLSRKCYLDFLYDNFDKFDDRIDFILIGKCDDRIESERITYTGYLDSIKDYVAQLSSLNVVLLVHTPMDPGPYTKILESMSCALAVFTTPKGIVGLDYVTPGEDILVFEEEQLIDKINELIFDDELMEKIGGNARVTVEKYYSKKANKKKLIDIIETLNANK